MLIRYEDFELIINETAGHLTVEARGPRQITVEPLPLGPDLASVLHKDEQLAEALKQLQRGYSPSRAQMLAIGRLLFAVLMPAQIIRAYDRAKGGLSEGTQLRLRLNVRPPTLSRLPWELLFDSTQNTFLAMRRAQPLVRVLDNPNPVAKLRIDGPLSVLLVQAQPIDLAPLNLEESKKALQEAFGRRAEIKVLPHATPAKLRLALQKKTFHILHYDGHGFFDEYEQSGFLALENNKRRSTALSGQQLANYLSGTQVRLVVLSACQTAQDSMRQRFVGVAQQLMRSSSLPAVVAMQFAIPDTSAVAFTRGFYGSLANGFPVDAALADGRMAIEEVTKANAPDWATPLLFMRTTEGKLWEQSKQSTTGTPKEGNLSSMSQQIYATKKASTPSQIFISYKRYAFPDEPLAKQIVVALEQQGHRVFIDQKMKIGVDWSRELQHQIEASDFMVVLLSEASVQSEMVAKEIEYAYHHQQRTGKARLLPVMLNYSGWLPYQISHYLERVQYAKWHSDRDTEQLIELLLQAINDVQPLPQLVPNSVEPTKASFFAPAPQPVADPRWIESLREPSGAISLRSDFYIERAADERLRRQLSKPFGTTTTIRAPRQTGKSSLLIRGIAQARKQRSKVVFVDLQPISNNYLQSLDSFLRYLATVIVTKLRLDPAEVENGWRGLLGPTDKITYLMEEYILPEFDRGIVLVLDEVDRLLDKPFHDNFFGLLRFWHNSRAMNELWDQLDLVMVISTEPHLLIADVTQSPFNVGVKLRLEDFNREQVAELNQRYRSPLQAHELPALLNFLGGHPYLTSKALYTMLIEKMSWPALLQLSPTDNSPFGDHLRRYLWLLQDKTLRQALKHVHKHGTCPDEVSYYRLLQAGLIKGSTSKSCVFRSQLYEEYLKGKV